jgi:hypothetical protein
MSAERWLPVVGYEGRYEVSDQGRVKSVARPDARGRRRAEKYLSPRVGARGHLSVALYAEGARDDRQIHTLVLTAFVGPCPRGMEGCHWNDTPADNRLENLRWDTRSANVADSIRNGTHAMTNRTSCPRGHAYTPVNTYRYPGGARACRECRRAYREERREERRAKGREYMRRRRAQNQSQTAAQSREVA